MTETEMTTEFIKTDDKRWVEFLSQVQHDIYHLPEYIEFSANHDDGEPLAFYFETNSSKSLIPLLRRELPDCLSSSGKWYDVTSPYGYASPLCWPEHDDSVLMSAISALKKRGSEEGMVTAFLRFHPLFKLPQYSLDNLGTLVFHGQTVYVDLNLSSEEIWHQTRATHRRHINKLVRQGYEVVLNDFDFFDDYKVLYQKTMERVEAKDSYFFSDAYFDDLVSTLGEKINMACVLSPSGEMTCGGLFSSYQGTIQLILSGTNERYINLSPSKLMYDFIRRWGVENNFKSFHMGGGVGAYEDHLFHFKAGFSNLRGAFHTLRVVSDPEKYQELNQKVHVINSSTFNDDDNYFPLYRKPFHFRMSG